MGGARGPGWPVSKRRHMRRQSLGIEEECEGGSEGGREGGREGRRRTFVHLRVRLECACGCACSRACVRLCACARARARARGECVCLCARARERVHVLFRTRERVHVLFRIFSHAGARACGVRMCLSVLTRVREHVCTRLLSALPRHAPASCRARASISPLSAPTIVPACRPAPTTAPTPPAAGPARFGTGPDSGRPVPAVSSPLVTRHRPAPPPRVPTVAASISRSALPSVAPGQARPSGSGPPCSASARPSARVCAPSSTSTPLAPAYATPLRIRPAQAVTRPAPARRAVASSRFISPPAPPPHGPGPARLGHGPHVSPAGPGSKIGDRRA